MSWHTSYKKGLSDEIIIEKITNHQATILRNLQLELKSNIGYLSI